MKKSRTIKKFGFAAIVASGLTAGFVGVAAPIQATASADALPVISLPGYSTGIDSHQRVGTTHHVTQVDATVQQTR